MADGAALRALELALLPGATLAHRSEHLRDHLAGTRDFHPIALANVLRFDQVEVVERGGGDRDTPDFHGLEHGIRVECAGASDIDPDLLRSEEHTSELQSHHDLVCRLLLEKKKTTACIYCRNLQE